MSRIALGIVASETKVMEELFDVRFGSKADMCSAKRHVRFTPESGHVRCKKNVRFVPIADMDQVATPFQLPITIAQ